MDLTLFFFARPMMLDALRQVQTQERMQAVRKKWKIKKDAERSAAVSDARVSRLEEDVGYMAVVLASILDRLDEKGVVTKDDVKETLRALGDLDGIREGRLDISFLREIASPGAANKPTEPPNQ